MPTDCRYPAAVRGRHLLDQHREPFFWLADTAWELVHRLNRSEIDRYIDTRARQGFNVCQFVLLAELDGLHTPNANGDLPLEDDDPTSPNEAYFKHVDYAVKALNDRGIVACLLPTWGDKVNPMGHGGPVIFNPDNAAVYGDWLGDRYRDASVVWMLGGDRKCETDEHREIFASMSAGLANGHGGRHLHTYHPRGVGDSVSHAMGDHGWLDFHSVQSGHTFAADPAGLLLETRKKTSKPVLESEPSYEDHPVMNLNWSDANGYFEPLVIRQRLYSALLAGSPGVTYGCHPVWQMYDEGRKPVNRVRRPWHEALTLPVAEQVGAMRKLFESLPWWDLEPAEATESRLTSTTGDGSLRVTYLPNGGEADGERFDPATGAALAAGKASQGSDVLVIQRIG